MGHSCRHQTRAPALPDATRGQSCLYSPPLAHIPAPQVTLLSYKHTLYPHCSRLSSLTAAQAPGRFTYSCARAPRCGDASRPDSVIRLRSCPAPTRETPFAGLLSGRGTVGCTVLHRPFCEAALSTPFGRKSPILSVTQNILLRHTACTRTNTSGGSPGWHALARCPYTFHIEIDSTARRQCVAVPA